MQKLGWLQVYETSGLQLDFLGTLTSCQAKLSENHQVLSRQPRLRVLGLVPSNIEVQEWLSVLLTTGFFSLQKSKVRHRRTLATSCNQTSITTYEKQRGHMVLPCPHFLPQNHPTSSYEISSFSSSAPPPGCCSMKKSFTAFVLGKSRPRRLCSGCQA